MIFLLPTATGKDVSGGAQVAILTPGGFKRVSKLGKIHGAQLQDVTKMLSTPMSVSKNPAAHGKSSGIWQTKINEMLAMLPTPTARDYKDTGDMENVPVNALLGRELGKNHGLKLQPAFAEWMLGFPIGWTELNV